ncbi:MAG: MvdC family ATP-grasp ribosomal peptide maturase [Candidatus Eisenbacteria bacterium]|nr:MvdC family ATP-grasp ribosomal peptide maturase [Candidatus Eisenbacteria bacterium]
MATPRVLLVTHSRDVFTVDRVQQALVDRGIEAVRLDTDRFPLGQELSLVIEGDSSRKDPRHEELSWDAVWLRKVWPPDLSDVDPEYAAAVRQEVQAFWRVFWDGVTAAGPRPTRWINNPVATFAAENKGRQLREARDIGLAVPDTVITNRMSDVRQLLGRHPGGIVSKMLTPLSVSLEGDGPFAYTQIVEREDLEDADSLRACPMVFQERIEAEVELRVVVIESEVYVGGIRTPGQSGSAEDIAESRAKPDDTRAATSARSSRSATEAAVDWRRGGTGAAWENASLSEETKDKVVALVQRLGLVYAALDLIRTPSGEDVFLEANPSGEWGMLERDLGLPIAESLARALAGSRPE